MTRKSSELKGLSASERKKLTEKVARGANKMQRKLIEQYDRLKNNGTKNVCEC